MGAILLLDELKDYLGITDDSSDTQLNSVLGDLVDYVQLQTGRLFGCVEEVTEAHDYNEVIFLDKMDVQSITWIKQGYSNDHDYEDDTTLKTLTSAEYRWSQKTGRILLAFPYRQNRSRYDYDEIVVRYKYGVNTVPGDIKLAAKQYAGDAFRNIDGEISAQSLDSYRLSYKPSTSAVNIFERNSTANA